MIELGRPGTTDNILGGVVPYNKKNAPWVFNDYSIDIYRDGVNCQTFAHLYYRTEFGVELPIGMWSKEILEDEEHFFRSLHSEESYLRGDIFLFGREDSKPKNLHVAVLHKAGQEIDSIVLRHANQEEGQISDWSMRRFVEHRRYPIVHAVKRVQSELFPFIVEPFLE